MNIPPFCFVLARPADFRQARAVFPRDLQVEQWRQLTGLAKASWGKSSYRTNAFLEAIYAVLTGKFIRSRDFASGWTMQCLLTRRPMRALSHRQWLRAGISY
jgi:hypothetical protein